MNATAPYNFVPLPSTIAEADPLPAFDRLDSARHTGWFDITIETLTPVYTRGALPVRNYPAPIRIKDGQSADFFHLGDDARTPVIPGSSLRGMIRSVFEVMTRSRMSIVTDRRFFFRDFAGLKAAGLREHYQQVSSEHDRVGGIVVDADGRKVLRVSRTSANGFVLVPADQVRNLAQKRNSTHFVKIVIRRGEDLHGLYHVAKADLAATGGIPAKVVIPGKDIGRGDFERRWYQAILLPQDGGPYTDHDIAEVVFDDYEAWGQMAHGKRFGTKNAPRRLKDGEPAFALIERTPPCAVMSLGANMMLPIRYRRGTRDAIPAPGSAPDMAQTLFGRVSDDDSPVTIRSRVFVEDSRCTSSSPWLDGDDGIRVPPPLLGPKPTSFQMYLEQQQDTPNIAHWDRRSSKLRGFKYYWHRPGDNVKDLLGRDVPDLERRTDTPDPDRLLTRIRPVDSAVTFEGRIRFENLSDAELGALYASVQLPEGFAHKIGMGKNLGLGSIRITDSGVSLFDPIARYRSLDPHAGRKAHAEVMEILSRSYTAFAIRLYGGIPTSLWNDPRMRELAALLSWSEQPAPEKTAQIGIAPPRDREHAGNQWRRRDKLPIATQIRPVLQVADVFSLPPSDLREDVADAASGGLPEEPASAAAQNIYDAILRGSGPAARTGATTTTNSKPGSTMPRRGDIVSGRHLGGGNVEVLDGQSAGRRIKGVSCPLIATGEIAEFKVTDVAGNIIKGLRFHSR